MYRGIGLLVSVINGHYMAWSEIAKSWYFHCHHSQYVSIDNTNLGLSVSER